MSANPPHSTIAASTTQTPPTLLSASILYPSFPLYRLPQCPFPYSLHSLAHSSTCPFLLPITHPPSSSPSHFLLPTTHPPFLFLLPFAHPPSSSPSHFLLPFTHIPLPLPHPTSSSPSLFPTPSRVRRVVPSSGTSHHRNPSTHR
ncbi:hypothetical protein Pcinc_031568 [Petrolisthes cinctipes]|uniref:Uncharacterized protein n=1 Tax=Petrolisthes cinctipes TaxID=88211 RepID=A0AAE1K2V1_PETCI|nr:hypothetical protein Pcinc_031568 [Petrolisthes cinctipes]